MLRPIPQAGLDAPWPLFCCSMDFLPFVELQCFRLMGLFVSSKGTTGTGLIISDVLPAARDLWHCLFCIERPPTTEDTLLKAFQVPSCC